MSAIGDLVVAMNDRSYRYERERVREHESATGYATMQKGDVGIIVAYDEDVVTIYMGGLFSTWVTALHRTVFEYL